MAIRRGMHFHTDCNLMKWLIRIINLDHCTHISSLKVSTRSLNAYSYSTYPYLHFSELFINFEIKLIHLVFVNLPVVFIVLS